MAYIGNSPALDETVSSSQIVDLTVATADIAADAITGAKIADDALDSEHYTDASIDLAHMSANSIDSNQYVDASIDNEHLADNAVGSEEIADNAVTLAKMAGLARGKIIYGDASGDPAALALGTDNHVLTVNGSDINWEAAAAGASDIDGLSDAVTTATSNIGLGSTAIDSITTGDYNVGLGDNAGTAITEGSNNVCIGYNSAAALTTNSDNIAIGYGALDAADGGEYGNVAIGSNAMGNVNHSSTSYDNVAIGKSVADGMGTIGGHDNVFIGNSAGGGTWVTSDSNYNIGIGSHALEGAMEGAIMNAAIGQSAMSGVTTGSYNQAMGYTAGSGITSGDANTLIGHAAGSVITDGESNTILGASANVDVSGATNRIVIGQNALGGTDNYARIGDNSYGASLNFGGSGNSWGDTSDERIKKDVRNIDIGLDFINKLRPIKYKDVNPADYPAEIKDRSFFDRTDAEGEIIPAFEKKEIPEPDKEMVGFLAQEVKATMDELGINFSGWEQEEVKEYGSTPLTDEQKAKGGTQRLQYARFVVPLIKAVQELSAKVEALENA